jgi:hypothetical protein
MSFGNNASGVLPSPGMPLQLLSSPGRGGGGGGGAGGANRAASLSPASWRCLTSPHLGLDSSLLAPYLTPHPSPLDLLLSFLNSHTSPSTPLCSLVKYQLTFTSSLLDLAPPSVPMHLIVMHAFRCCLPLFMRPLACPSRACLKLPDIGSPCSRYPHKHIQTVSLPSLLSPLVVRTL